MLPQLKNLLKRFTFSLLLIVSEASAQGNNGSDVEISLTPSVTLEYAPINSENVLGAIDAIHTMPAFASIEMKLESDSGVGIRLVPVMVREYSSPSNTNVPIGVTGNPVLIENNLLYEGTLYLPFFDGVAIIGRQKVSFGPSATSNLQISNGIPFVDGVYYRIPLGLLTIEQVFATLENRAGIGDLDFTTDLSDYDFDITNVFVSSRRFSLNLDGLELGIGAQAIISRPNNVLLMGDIIPIFSVHNADVGYHNFTLFLDSSWNISDFLRIYGIVGLDDFNAGTVGIADTGVPTIYAFSVGADGRIGEGDYSFAYSLEGVTTHYLWGSFYERYYLSRSIYRLKSDSGNLLLPLTSPYGPARTSLDLYGTLDLPLNLLAGFHGLLLYGDPSINLATMSYDVAAIQNKFLLMRGEVQLKVEIGDTLALGCALGFDVAPTGDSGSDSPFEDTVLSPRLSFSLNWTKKFSY